MEREFIEINGEKISYLSEPNPNNKPIMVFVHGFADEAKRALSLYRIPNRNYCLYSIDLPCCGESSCSVKSPKIEFFGEILTEFIKKIFNKPVYLISHSLGAISSLIAAKNGLVKHLFACTPTTYVSKNFEKIVTHKKYWTLPRNKDDLRESFINLFSAKELQSLPATYLENHVNGIPDSFYKDRQNKFSKLVLEQMINKDYIFNKVKPLYDSFKDITLFIAGDDHYIHSDDLLDMAKEQNLEYVLFPEAGHAVFYQNGEKINDFVEKYIEKYQ